MNLGSVCGHIGPWAHRYVGTSMCTLRERDREREREREKGEGGGKEIERELNVNCCFPTALYELQTLPEQTQSQPLVLGSYALLVARFVALYGPSRTGRS